jgi:hypothetical protein
MTKEKGPPRRPARYAAQRPTSAAQDRIGIRGRDRLAVGEQCGLRRDRFDARQAITLAGAVDVTAAMPGCIGKDLIKIDLRRRCRCRRKRSEVRPRRLP